MANLKLTLVGGGSYTWGPNLIRNILGTPYLRDSHVVLHDLNPEALGDIYALAEKYRQVAGASLTFEQTTDPEQALEGADYVIVTIATGGLRAMRNDLQIPERYSICHTVGDTAGPAGLSRALRGVPVFLNLARAVEQHCPRAWLLNCSNPLSALTRVVNKETGVRALGVCHGVRNRVRIYARFFGAEEHDCSYVNTGIDHCSWFTEFRVKGRPAQDILEEMGFAAWLKKPAAEARTDPVFAPLYEFRCSFLLGQCFGALPAISDRHLIEFFPHFLRGAENVARYGLVRTSIEDRERSAAETRERVRRWLSGEEELPDITSGASDNIAGWIAALEGATVLEDNLNAPNYGQVPQLPAEAIVETRGMLDATGMRPLVSPLPPALVPVVAPHVMREELTVEAAVAGDFDKALAVMASDPLVADVETARPLLEDLIAANREWLPQFT